MKGRERKVHKWKEEKGKYINERKRKENTRMKGSERKIQKWMEEKG